MTIYPVGTKVSSPALGKDPPFEGMIIGYEGNNYIIFDKQRAKRWVRTQAQIVVLS